MSSYRSYPKIYNLGHAAVRDLFMEPVVVQEKVDGSQFSFGVHDGELKCRSKGKEQYPATDKMFEIAIAHVHSLFADGRLVEGWTYSGEYLSRPKHNTLTYGRVPTQNIAIFDIRVGEEDYLDYEDVQKEAKLLGFETVPTFKECVVNSVEDVMELMERESFLGGCKIEGLVFKNYRRFSRDGKALMGKHVSEAFKERNSKDFRDRNPQKQDMIAMLGGAYRTDARWDKAIFRLRDEGKLTGEPKDIGPLIKAIQADVEEECGEEIRERLFKWAWRQLERRVVAGFPEYYKRKLAEAQFDSGE